MINMTITEFAELDHRLKKAEQKLNQYIKEISIIKEKMNETSGILDHNSPQPRSYFYDEHTPYFDVIGEYDPKIKK